MTLYVTNAADIVLQKQKPFGAVQLGASVFSATSNSLSDEQNGLDVNQSGLARKKRFYNSLWQKQHRRKRKLPTLAQNVEEAIKNDSDFDIEDSDVVDDEDLETEERHA